MPLPTPLKKYKLVKDNYCICYYGINKEYIVQLRLLRPFIEKQFEGLSIYICCSDDSMYLLREQKNVFAKSRINELRDRVSYIRTLEDSTDSHPVEDLLKESGILCPALKIPSREIRSKKCALLTNGVGPVRSLTGKQISLIVNKFEKEGFRVIINPKIEEIIEDFEVVVGVESVALYESACRGLRTCLVPTGIGKNLFDSMFPSNEAIRLEDQVNI